MINPIVGCFSRTPERFVAMLLIASRVNIVYILGENCVIGRQLDLPDQASDWGRVALHSASLIYQQRAVRLVLDDDLISPRRQT